ncbi:MAG: hypothetical protein WD206_03505 [Actinomycetota bacterium]
MPDLVPTEVGVVAVHATPAALDALEIPGAAAFRVAPDESLLLTSPDASGEVAAQARRGIDDSDPDALVLDATDGWAMWTLTGTGTPALFERLSALPLPERGFVQGDVAHLPVKVVVDLDGAHLLVASMWRAYLRERILDRGASLGVSEAEARSWTTPVETS